MKICVVGAGAIGGLLAAKLAASGNEITILEQPSQASALAANGLRLVQSGKPDVHVRPAVTTDWRQIRPQDLVILGVKAFQLPQIAPNVTAMLAPDGHALSVQNGIPWWFFSGYPGPLAGHRLLSVDPDGAIADSLPVERVVGAVVYPAAKVVAPGTVQLVEGNRVSLGEPDNRRSSRVAVLSKLFAQAGFKSPVVPDIRAEIFVKLWGNISVNPVSALTGAGIQTICDHPQGRQLVVALMREAKALGEKLGLRSLISIDTRIAGARSLGNHKTSMLQDIEAGRPTEIEALLGAVLEIGRLLQVQMPSIEAIYAAVKVLDETRKLNGAGQVS